LNGTIFVVSDSPQNVPDIVHIISKAHYIQNGEENVRNREPTEKEIQVISTAQALKLFGHGAHIIDGVSVSLSLPLSTQLILMSSCIRHISFS
jgi:hypothetical protein